MNPGNFIVLKTCARKKNPGNFIRLAKIAWRPLSKVSENKRLSITTMRLKKEQIALHWPFVQIGNT